MPQGGSLAEERAQHGGEVHRGAVGVLMKPMPEVASAKENSLPWRAGVQRREFTLGFHGAQCVDGVLVVGLVEDGLGTDLVGAIHGDKVVAGFADALKGVHPIVRRRFAVAMFILLDSVVPGRPSSADSWHDGVVRMKRGGVFLISERTQQAAVGFIGCSQHGKGFVGMGGDDDTVELEQCSILDADGGRGFGFLHFNGLGRELDRSKVGQELVPVAARTPADSEPWVVGRDSEKSVVLKKADEAQCRKIQHLTRIGGPHRRAHRDEVEVEEIDAQAVLVHKFANGAVQRVGFVQQRSGNAEEAQDLENEGVEARVEDVAPLGEKFVQPHAIVFEAARQVLDAEGHFRGLRLDAEFLEEPHQMGVCGMVEDDESCIDGDFVSVFFDRHGIRVSTGPGFALDECDIGVVAELPSRAHAGNARADDADSFSHWRVGCSSGALS